MSRNRVLKAVLLLTAWSHQAFVRPSLAAEPAAYPPAHAMEPMQQLPEANAEILAVNLNGLAVDSGLLLLRDADNHLYAPAIFFDNWNLQEHPPGITASDGTVYFELDGIEGLDYQWNNARAELDITAAGKAFKSNNLDGGESRYGDIAPYTTGGYLNYDVALTQGPQNDSAGAFLELAFFRNKGLFTTSFLARDTGSARLMTTWQTDFVDKSRTLVIGDAYNNSSAWGLGVLYGGLRYGTNFELRPDYIPFATPGVAGNALLPSSVDVYVNNVLRSHEDIKAGPFSIQNLPAITGSGDMQVIITDLLGREQVMTQSFYVNPILLRRGLNRQSVEIGRQRNNYGLVSNDYGDLFAAATYRTGITDTLTTEAHLELQEHSRTAGVSVATRIPGLASVIETSAAFSNTERLGSGSMTSLRFSYQGERWSANARAQLNSATFRQLGSNLASLPKQVLAGQLSMPLDTGTLSINYLRQLNQGDSLTRIANLSYSKRIFGKLQASFTLLQTLSGPGGTAAQFSLMRVLGTNNIATVTADSQPEEAGFYSQYQHATPRERGTGYRLAMMNGGLVSRQEAQVSHNEDFGSLQWEVVQIEDDVSTRQMVQGSIATIGNGFFLTRSLNQGFSIVDTNGIANVPVMLENQIVTRTDKRGLALVSNVQPYQPNRISIDPLALPMDASVGVIEQIVMPRRCGCVLVSFDISSMRSATLIITLPDGQPLPPWTRVNVTGAAPEYVVGSRGEVFVDLPYPTNNLVTATLADGQVCRLYTDQPPVAELSPFMGPLQCTITAR